MKTKMVNKISLNDFLTNAIDIKVMIILRLRGKMGIYNISPISQDENLFVSYMSVYNSIKRLEKRGLIKRNGTLVSLCDTSINKYLDTLINLR